MLAVLTLFAVASSQEPELVFEDSSNICSIFMDSLGQIGSTCGFHLEDSLAAKMDQKINANNVLVDLRMGTIEQRLDDIEATMVVDPTIDIVNQVCSYRSFYYPLETIDGFNQISNFNEGDLRATSTLVQGKIGNGWSRPAWTATNGASTNGGAAFPSNMHTAGDWSVSFWFKPSTHVCHDDTYSYGNNCAGILWLDGTKSWPADFRMMGSKVCYGTSTYECSTSDLPLDQWAHLSVTHTAAGLKSYYLNGQLDWSYTAAPADSFVRGDMWFANYNSHGGNTNNHFAVGTIDELQGWSIALTATQIAIVYAKENTGTSALCSSAVLVPTPAPTSNPVCIGEVAGFSLNTASVTNAARNTGTTVVTGIVGKAWSRPAFPGSMGGGASFTSPISKTDTWSLSFWFNPSDHVCHDAAHSYGNNCAGILWTDGEKSWSPQFRLMGSAVCFGADKYSCGSDLPIDQWSHLAMVVDSASTIKWYVNGVVESEKADAEGIIRGQMQFASYVNAGGNTNDHYTAGAIDELHVWDRTLSDAEIESVFTTERLGHELC